MERRIINLLGDDMNVVLTASAPDVVNITFKEYWDNTPWPHYYVALTDGGGYVVPADKFIAEWGPQ